MLQYLSKFLKYNRFLSCLTVLVLLSTPALARFINEDAERIDPEQRLNTESYNDKASYRYPVSWIRRWGEKSSGYRVNAGSLNANRFDYADDIKLVAAKRQPISLAFYQTRREDVTKTSLQRELRVTWALPQDFWLALLGDGGTYKEYGDIGAALTYSPQASQHIEFYYWSVDHFYATKKSEPESKRDHRLWTAGFDGHLQLADAWRLSTAVEYDSPLSWQRPSLETIYEYERTSAQMHLSYMYLPTTEFYLSSEYVSKNESLMITNDTLIIDTNSSKYTRLAMQHESGCFEVGGIYSANRRDTTTALQYIAREVNYDQAGDVATLAGEKFPSAVNHYEWGSITTHHFPISNSQTHFAQLGAHLNAVRIREDATIKQNLEIKLQTAWDYLISPDAAVLLNATWDLDQIGRDLPYKNRPFRPWGGGSIQFQMTL
jgi:hypothetical protein